MSNPTEQSHLSWQVIESRLPDLEPTEGGFSAAKRGLLALDDRTLFVKYGSDDDTNHWANKEIRLYRMLEAHGYQHIPRLVATNPDETGFALEAYAPQDGWDWQDNWSEERLAATLQALDELAVLPLSDSERSYLVDENGMTREEDGWAALSRSDKAQHTLAEMLRSSTNPDVLDDTSIAQHAQRSSSYIFKNDTFVHYDLRADNCAWNPYLRQVKIVDWNWAQIGDRDIEMAATMTSVQKSGFALSDALLKSLNPAAFHWMAGFWLFAATRPIWLNGPEHLRGVQLQSGITALELAARVQSLQ